MKVGFKSNTIDSQPKVDTVNQPKSAPKAEDISAEDMMNELFETGLEETVDSSDSFGYINDYIFRPGDATGFQEFEIPDPKDIIERFAERFDRQPRKSEIDAIIDKYKKLVYEDIPAQREAYAAAKASGDLSPAELAVIVQNEGALQKKEADGLQALDTLAKIKEDKIAIGKSEIKAMYDLDGDGTIDDTIGFVLDAEGKPTYFDLETGVFLDIIPNLAADPVAFKNVRIPDESEIPSLSEGAPIPDTYITLDLDNFDAFAQTNDFQTGYLFTPPDTIYVKMDDNYTPKLSVEDGNDYDPTYITYPWSVDADGNFTQNLDDVDKTEYMQVQVARVKVTDIDGNRYFEFFDKSDQLISRICGIPQTTTANVPYGKPLAGGQREVSFAAVGFGVDASESLLHKEYDFSGCETYTRHTIDDIANKFDLTRPENDGNSAEYERRMRAYQENINTFSGTTYTAEVYDIGKAADATENDGFVEMTQSFDYGSGYHDTYIDDDNDVSDVLKYEGGDPNDPNDATNGLPEGCTLDVDSVGDRVVTPVDTWRTGVFFKGKGAVTGTNSNDFIVMENDNRQDNEDWDKFFPEVIDRDSPLNFSYYKSNVGSDFLVSHHGNVAATGVSFADVKTDPGGFVYLKEASGSQVGVKWNEAQEIENMPRNLKTSFTVDSEGGEVNLMLHDEINSTLDTQGVEGEDDKYSHWRPSTYDDYYNINSNASVFTNMTDNDDLASCDVNVTHISALGDDIDQAMSDGWNDLLDEIQRIRTVDDTDIQQKIDQETQGDYEAEMSSFLGDFFGEVNNEWDSVESEINEDIGDVESDPLDQIV